MIRTYVTIALAAACTSARSPATPDAPLISSDSSHGERDGAEAAPLQFDTVTTADQETLRAVWGASDTDIWIATDNDGGGYGRIMHATDGATFADVASSGSFTGLYAIWGSSATDVWFAGGSDPGDGVRALLHWDGVSWADHHAEGSGLYFLGAAGSGANDAWFVGEQALLHWDGSTFTSAGSETTHLIAAWAAPGHHVFVGTNGFLETEVANSATEIGNGSTLRSVSGTSATDVWAVGDGGQALHFDGTHWATTDTGTAHDLYAVRALASDDVIAVGGAGTVLRWNGASWSANPLPAADALVTFRAIWATTQHVWIVGDGGTALRATLGA